MGTRVRVQHSVAGVPPALEADLFAIDGARGLIVLRRVHAHTYQKADYFFIPIAAVTGVEKLGEGEKTAIANIGLAEIRRRLRDATETEQRKIACRGVGVSEQDQRLFLELRKQCVRRAQIRPPCCLRAADGTASLLQTLRPRPQLPARVVDRADDGARRHGHVIAPAVDDQGRGARRGEERVLPQLPLDQARGGSRARARAPGIA